MELKASVLPMSCTDADLTMFLIAEISKSIKIVKSVKLYGWIWLSGGMYGFKEYV